MKHAALHLHPPAPGQLHRLFLAFAVAIPLAAQDHAGESEHETHGEEIHLTPEDFRDFGLRLDTAGPGSVHETLRFPGEIRMNEHAVAHVSPRFAGIVTKIHQRLGDTVVAGQLLAELESNETLRPFALIAPLDGTIVDFHLTLGESLEAGAYAYVIADTSTVWADLQVFQRDLPRIRPGQPVRLSAGHDYPAREGILSYLGPVVDEATRTGLARATLDNPDGFLRPGLFIIGEVEIGTWERPVVVPLSALVRDEDETRVYVLADEANTFVPRAVTVGVQDDTQAEIAEGLHPGERYVSEGGFFLKAEGSKEHFGHGHGH